MLLLAPIHPMSVRTSGHHYFVSVGADQQAFAFDVTTEPAIATSVIKIDGLSTRRMSNGHGSNKPHVFGPHCSPWRFHGAARLIGVSNTGQQKAAARSSQT